MIRQSEFIAARLGLDNNQLTGTIPSGLVEILSLRKYFDICCILFWTNLTFVCMVGRSVGCLFVCLFVSLYRRFAP